MKSDVTDVRGERFLRVGRSRFSVFQWFCGASGGHFQANRRAEPNGTPFEHLRGRGLAGQGRGERGTHPAHALSTTPWNLQQQCQGAPASCSPCPSPSETSETSGASGELRECCSGGVGAGVGASRGTWHSRGRAHEGCSTDLLKDQPTEVITKK